MQPLSLISPWALLSAIALVFCACTDPPAPPRRNAPAPRQFTATNIRIEEQRDGRVVWSGTATAAEGDFSNAEVRDVELVRHPSGDQPELTFRAQRGNLTFEDGSAEFDDVSIHHPDGAVLTATRAVHEESSQSVQVEGPLELRSASLSVHGTHASIHLDGDIIDVVGPIEGRWSGQPAQSP